MSCDWQNTAPSNLKEKVIFYNGQQLRLDFFKGNVWCRVDNIFGMKGKLLHIPAVEGCPMWFLAFYRLRSLNIVSFLSSNWPYIHHCTVEKLSSTIKVEFFYDILCDQILRFICIFLHFPSCIILVVVFRCSWYLN